MEEKGYFLGIKIGWIYYWIFRLLRLLGFEMADFCNRCALENKFPQPDIDVFEIYKNTPRGYTQPGLLCEGCGLMAVTHFDDGSLKVIYRTNELENGKVKYYDYGDHPPAIRLNKLVV